jgi:oxygen-independent coproporphyrinogen-3 oxidase
MEKTGIYIHVPFCVKKCSYCDFYSITDLEKIPSFVHALALEIKMTDALPSDVNTIYIGGGTPSLLDPEKVEYFIDAIYNRFCVISSPEVTMEINPGTVTHKKLTGYRKAGINRINIGVQSFSDQFLSFLSRIHTVDEAVSCVKMARRAGFENIGLDLIYGLPEQTEKLWQSDLESAIKLKPEHLSCYMLTYEPGTPMTKDLINKRFKALSENDTSELFDFTSQFLEENGYLHYEVSNFASSRKTRSIHNRKYWFHAPYIGFGPAAHSFIDNRRYWNVRSVNTYMQRIQTGKRPVAETETLDPKQQMMEVIYLRLRCAEGICMADFESRFNVCFNQLFGHVVDLFEPKGFIKIVDGHCRLTPSGMRFSDSIAARFIEEI